MRYFSHSKNNILTSNFKVMYSTLEAQENLAREHPCIPRKLFLGKFFLTRTRHFMLVRNPYDRIVSFYADKCVAHPPRVVKEGQTWQGCQKLLWPHIGILPHEDDETKCRKILSLTFSGFIDILPKIYDKDGHLCPQAAALDFKWRDITTKCRVDSIIKMEEIDKLCKLGIDLSIWQNKTDRQHYSRYFDKRSYAVINDIYKDDFKRFGYEMRL